LLNAAGALVWAAAIASGGFFFGRALEVLIGKVKHYEIISQLKKGGAYMKKRKTYHTYAAVIAVLLIAVYRFKAPSVPSASSPEVHRS